MRVRSLLLLSAFYCSAGAAVGATACPAGGEFWSSRCFDTAGDTRRVKPRYLNRLTWNRHGIALVSTDATFELLAVNRKGEVVVPNIRHTGDFDYPDAEGGVGRFGTPDHGKCGYFQAPQFTIVVPARYDHCTAFHDGEALACTGCTEYCDDEDCHMHRWIGGEGVVLDPAGAVRGTFKPPTLETVCGTAQPPTITRRPGTPLLQCARGAGPFDHLK